MSPAAFSRWSRGKIPGFSDRLRRGLVWDLPGFFSGRDETVITRTLTDAEMRLELRAMGSEPDSAISSSRAGVAPLHHPMHGDFSAIRARLLTPRAAHCERPPAAPIGEVREMRGAFHLRLALARASEYEITAGANPLSLLRHEITDWRWSSGPFGQSPGGAPRSQPPKIVAVAPTDAPLVLAAPLAAYLLARFYQAGALSSGQISPLAATQPFDDEGFAPAADGSAARRSLLEPWPERHPCALTWAGDAALAPLEKLSASFLAFSFAAFECDRGHFSWTLPLFACRDGKMTGSAGVHHLSGKVQDLLSAIQGRGRTRTAWEVSPRCESPALILRPLSKLRGKLSPAGSPSSPDPAPGLRDAEAFIRALR